MDIKYLEEQFLEFWKHCYGNQDISFYVSTDEHSSGFNQIKIESEGFGEYSVYEEDCCSSDYLIFEDIIKKYPKITLNREYAFYGKFETWEDIELAFKGEKEIDLVRI
jgi:hypothetical protein